MTENDALRVLSDQDLNRFQPTTLQYYLHEANPENGLIRDKTEKGAPASISSEAWSHGSSRPRSPCEGFDSSATARTDLIRTRPATGLLLSFPRHEDRSARVEL